MTRQHLWYCIELDSIGLFDIKPAKKNINLLHILVIHNTTYTNLTYTYIGEL